MLYVIDPPSGGALRLGSGLVMGEQNSGCNKLILRRTL